MTTGGRQRHLALSSSRWDSLEAMERTEKSNQPVAAALIIAAARRQHPASDSEEEPGYRGASVEGRDEDGTPAAMFTAGSEDSGVDARSYSFSDDSDPTVPMLASKRQRISPSEPSDLGCPMLSLVYAATVVFGKDSEKIRARNRLQFSTEFKKDSNKSEERSFDYFQRQRKGKSALNLSRIPLDPIKSEWSREPAPQRAGAASQIRSSDYIEKRYVPSRYNSKREGLPRGLNPSGLAAKWALSKTKRHHVSNTGKFTRRIPELKASVKKPKRKRTSNACVNCNKKKQGCDWPEGEAKCRRCERLGRECVRYKWKERTIVKKPPKPKPAPYIVNGIQKKRIADPAKLHFGPCDVSWCVRPRTHAGHHGRCKCYGKHRSLRPHICIVDTK